MKVFTRLSSLVFTCLVFAFAARGQVDLGAINTMYLQNFDSLAAAGTSSIIPRGWLFVETGTNANGIYSAGTGSSNAGDTYSFGATGSSERAFGGLRSGSLVPNVGASFVNNTGTIINALQIAYTGEQWRLGTLGRTDRLDFQYSFNASSLTSGTWIDVDELDFNAPLNSGTVGAKVGNDVHTQLSHTIDGLNIPAGATFFIRWLDVDVSGADDGLGVDDFSLLPVGTPSDQPTITLSPGTINFGSVTVNQTDTVSYLVTGKNLTDSIAVSVSNPLFTLSLNGTAFTNQVMLPAIGGRVTVRFAPLADGVAIDSIHHTSGTSSKSLVVAGNGFNQSSHIIPIASARLQPIGNIVTVAGRITVGLEQGNPSYIQDASGGIPIFDFALSHTVHIGDTVIVTGPIGVFNQMKQISGAGIFFSIPDSSIRILDPKLISINDLAANEGLLVTVDSVELVDKAFVFYPQSTERMTDGTVQADLRIDGDTNIPGFNKPQGRIDVTGVVGRFNTNAQLLPRFIADIPGSTVPSTPADTIPKTRTLDIINWNLEFFGARFEDYHQEFGPADEALQLQNVRTVLNSLDADIIAVEEVSNDSLFAALVSQMPGKAFTCSERWSHFFDDDGTFPPQKVCFIYDTTTVHVLSARPMFKALFDEARTTNPGLLPDCPGGASSFYSSGRLPYLLSARVTIDGVTEDISLIVVHAKSGATEDDRVRRLYDGAVLKDSLDANLPTTRFIYLGDLNDDLDTSIVPGAATPYANYAADTARYLPITLPLSHAGARSTVSFQDVIDHQIISNEMVKFYIPGSAEIVTPFALIPSYAATTSDHLPVISRYILPPAIVSFANAGQNISEDSALVNVVVNFNEPLSTAREIAISIGGSAGFASDYMTSPVATDGKIILAIPAGATSGQFSVTPIDDAIDEVQETVVFTLQAAAGLATQSPSTFKLTIEDNDIPTIAFASPLGSAVAGSGPHPVKFKISSPPATDQSVSVRAFDGFLVDYGDDYTTDPAVVNGMITVVIPAGSQDGQFELTPLSNHRRRLPLKTIQFQLAQASEGLEISNPLMMTFTLINNIHRQLHFGVFPNPTHGVFHLSCDELEPGEVIAAVLRNNNGGSLLSTSGTLAQINDALGDALKHERSGIYTLSIVADDETIVMKILKF